MSQVSGAVTLDLDLGRLADQLALRLASVMVTDELAGAVAARVAEHLHAAGRSGSDAYERGADPDPGSGNRHGARFGAVTDDGTEYDDGPTE